MRTFFFAVVDGVGLLEKLSKVLLQGLQGQDGTAADHHLVELPALIKRSARRRYILRKGGSVFCTVDRRKLFFWLLITSSVAPPVNKVPSATMSETLRPRTSSGRMGGVALMGRVHVETDAVFVGDEDAVVQRIYHDLKIDALGQKDLQVVVDLLRKADIFSGLS